MKLVQSLLPRSIQARLILSHMLVSLISIALISAYAGQALFLAVHRQVEHHYEDLAFAAVNDVEQSFISFLAGQTPAETVTQIVSRTFSQTPGVQYTFYLPGGEPVIDSTGALPPPATIETTPELWDALNRGTGEGEYFRWTLKDGELFYLAVRIEQNEQVYGILHIKVPLDDAVTSSRRSLGLLISSALLVGMGMSIFGYYLARGLAGPIQKMTLTAESLAKGDMSARVELPPDPQEMHRLAIAFNQMATGLQSHVSDLRSFVANASHELRTPLTSIKLRVEALRDGALEDPAVSHQFLAEIESEVDRLSTMVNDLLDLSRIEAGLEAGKRAPVDLATLAGEVAESFRVRSERAGIQLISNVTPDLSPVMGNEDQLRRMLFNLVDNAIKYTAHGGEVKISLNAGDQPETIRLEVSDTGFGIPTNQIAHIFERFYRVEATRPRFGPSQGSGLGLPIAKSIVDSHKGEIGVRSQVGKGTVFWVVLPVDRSE